MKTLISTLSLLVLAAAAVAAPAGGWFDLEDCSMCKHLTADQELFSNMKWETRLFANGLVEVTTVPAAYEPRFKALMKNMEATGQRLMAGEQLYMCGMCQSYGKLMMGGAQMDYLTVGENHISVISSQDPKVVAMIRTHGQTTIDEYAKWMAAEGGHDHGHEHKHDCKHDHKH